MRFGLDFALALSALIAPTPLFAQAASQPMREAVGVPARLYAAPNLVTNTNWISGTIQRSVVLVGFKNGVTVVQRQRIYNLVNARAVYVDAEGGSPPLFYLIVVNTDPDACAVKQATELLESQPEVEMASPYIVSSADGEGGLRDVPGTPLGTGRECPAGTDLLR